jgi:hypothetical protein
MLLPHFTHSQDRDHRIPPGMPFNRDKFIRLKPPQCTVLAVAVNPEGCQE